MKVKDRKPNARPAKRRLRSAAPVKTGAGTQGGPKKPRLRANFAIGQRRSPRAEKCAARIEPNSLSRRRERQGGLPT